MEVGLGNPLACPAGACLLSPLQTVGLQLQLGHLGALVPSPSFQTPGVAGLLTLQLLLLGGLVHSSGLQAAGVAGLLLQLLLLGGVAGTAQ